MSNEELAKVQAEIDTAISSLQKYMESISDEHASPEDAAIAIHNYATPRGIFEGEHVPLEQAIQCAVNAKRRYQVLDETAEQGCEAKQEKLVPALAALGEWSDFGGQVLRHHHMTALWLSAFRYGQGMTQFFGQDAGLELRGKREVDPRLDTRVFAADHVLKLNREDPQRYPMTLNTFSDVGALYGLSGSRVRDFLYSKEGKRILPLLHSD